MHTTGENAIPPPPAPRPQRIDSAGDIAFALRELLAADARLGPVAAVAGAIPLRREAADFRGLARLVVAQLVSAASARAIWNRLEAAGGAGPEGFLRLGDEGWKAAGLSRAKAATIAGLARAVAEGRLDPARLVALSGAEAHAALTAFRGIGPWTADTFLMFCAGHPDIFPAGDMALRIAVGEALGLAARPDSRHLAAIAEAWQPWRAVAARLFWAYYGARRTAGAGLPLPD